jgi:hypothetical protein
LVNAAFGSFDIPAAGYEFTPIAECRLARRRATSRLWCSTARCFRRPLNLNRAAMLPRSPGYQPPILETMRYREVTGVKLPLDPFPKLAAGIVAISACKSTPHEPIIFSVWDSGGESVDRKMSASRIASGCCHR